MSCCPVPTKAMLAQAEQAYHDLVLGNKPRVIVDQNGERVEFSSANRNDLYQYIQQLRSVLCADMAAGNSRPNGPAGFVF